MVTMPKSKQEPMMVSVERSFGTAFGFNAMLIKLEGAGDPPEVKGEK